MLRATHWGGLLVCFCLFVCLFVFSQSIYTCIPVSFVFLKVHARCSVPPTGEVYVFVFVCLFVCVFSKYMYPTHGGFVVYFVPAIFREDILVQSCVWTLLSPTPCSLLQTTPVSDTLSLTSGRGLTSYIGGR